MFADMVKQWVDMALLGQIIHLLMLNAITIFLQISMIFLTLEKTPDYDQCLRNFPRIIVLVKLTEDFFGSNLFL